MVLPRWDRARYRSPIPLLGSLSGLAACASARRPKPLLTRAHGGVEARPGPVQRAASAAAEGAQAIGCSFAEIGDTVGHVVANVVSPVIAGYAASDRAKEESKQSVPSL